MDGTALVLGVWVHFAHGLQHPLALVANNELHTVQPTAAEPLEEAHPAGFVLFHPLGSAQDFTVTVFIDCDGDQNGYVFIFSAPVPAQVDAIHIDIRITENFVLGELIKTGTASESDVYYWSSGNTAEVDFVLQCGADIVPIEVKSEKNLKARSLAEYRKKYEPRVSVKTSMKSDVGGGEVLDMPLYMIGSLRALCENV